MHWCGIGATTTARRFVFAAFVSAASFAVPGMAWAGPFDNLSGSWGGEGLLSLSSGSNERLVCRATYTVNNGGNELVQDLRCASDSYALDVASTVTYAPDSDALEGIWEVTNYGVGGSLSGVLSGGWVSAWVRGNGFLALVQISMGSSVQNVVIKPDGFDVTEVTVTMQKSS